MDSLLLQDFVTVSGLASSPGITLTQGSGSWLDLSAYEDVVFFVDVKNCSINLNPTELLICLQTAPAMEDASFLTMYNEVTFAGVLAAFGVTPIPLVAVASPIPLANYVRWQIPLAQYDTSGPFTATFRIWVSAYAIGC
jgi:hypothetical protein